MNQQPSITEVPRSAPTSSPLTGRDYFLITFIGFSFALFSIPILPNVIPGLSVTPAVFLGLLAFLVAGANAGLWIASKIAKKIPVVLQIAKFGAVGAFNTFLDWGVVNLLIALTGIAKGIFFSTFAGAGFIVANIGSFFWNKYWTFSSSKKGDEPKKGNIGQFFAVSVVGFGLKVAVASLIVNLIGVQGGATGEQWANVGNVSGTVISMVWNFVGYKFWVFKK